MTEAQKEKIIRAVRILEPTAQTDPELLELTISTAVDRVLLFLRAKTLDPRIENIIAQIVAKAYRVARANKESGETTRDVKSISDNGQSITYSDNPAQFMATSTDQELLDGFAELLSTYRRVNVLRK